jgi:hypothetical protein
MKKGGNGRRKKVSKGTEEWRKEEWTEEIKTGRKEDRRKERKTRREAVVWEKYKEKRQEGKARRMRVLHFCPPCWWALKVARSAKELLRSTLLHGVSNVMPTGRSSCYCLTAIVPAPTIGTWLTAQAIPYSLSFVTEWRSCWLCLCESVSYHPSVDSIHHTTSQRL